MQHIGRLEVLNKRIWIGLTEIIENVVGYDDIQVKIFYHNRHEICSKDKKESHLQLSVFVEFRGV